MVTWACVMALMTPGLKGQGPEFDLLIRNGHVIDPRNTDVAVLNVRRGTFGFVDSGGGKLTGDRKPECELTVKGGQVVWDLNGISRPLWTEMR